MKKKYKNMDIIKANRKGSRDAEIECSTGWKAVRKVHKSKRTYTRKNKGSGNTDSFFLPHIFVITPFRQQISFSANRITLAEKLYELWS